MDLQELLEVIRFIAFLGAMRHNQFWVALLVPDDRLRRITIFKKNIVRHLGQDLAICLRLMQPHFLRLYRPQH